MKLTFDQIEKLEAYGNRWQKAGKDRIYIKPWALGLKAEEYTPGYAGKIKNASYTDENGEEVGITISAARRILWSKVYVDVETGELFGAEDWEREGLSVDVIRSIIED